MAEMKCDRCDKTELVYPDEDRLEEDGSIRLPFMWEHVVVIDRRMLLCGNCMSDLRDWVRNQ